MHHQHNNHLVHPNHKPNNPLVHPNLNNPLVLHNLNNHLAHCNHNNHLTHHQRNRGTRLYLRLHLILPCNQTVAIPSQPPFLSPPCNLITAISAPFPILLCNPLAPFLSLSLPRNRTMEILLQHHSLRPLWHLDNFRHKRQLPPLDQENSPATTARCLPS